MAAERPAGVAGTLADRVAQNVGQGRTGPGGVGWIGGLACIHGVIEAGLGVLARVNCGAGGGGTTDNGTPGQKLETDF